MALGTPASLGTATQASAIAATLAIASTLVTANVGDLICIATHGGSNNAATSVTDSAGNTYTAGATTITNGTRTMRMFWSRIANALNSGGSITVTFAASAGTKNVTAAAISGTAASPLDLDGTGNSSLVGGASTIPTITTGTLAQAAEVIFGATYVSLGAADAFNPAPGFTVLNSANLAGAGAGVLHMDYAITASTAAVTYAPTLGASQAWMINYQSFKEAGGVTGHPSALLLLGVG